VTATVPADPAVLPRRFLLNRWADDTGVSGTGLVACGVQFPDGVVALRWRGPHASTAIWSGIDSVRAIHGHDGRTEVVWLDNQNGENNQ
jgi:hypothetical protein